MKSQDLLKLIDASFSKVKPPSHENWQLGVPFLGSEYSMAAKFFNNIDRDQLDLEKLEGYEGDFTTIIFFMPFEALLYYFPAFLRITIEEYERGGGSLFDSILLLLYGGLSIEEKKYLSIEAKKYLEKFIDMLTNDQKLTLIEYLKYMNSKHPDDFHFVSFEELKNSIGKSMVRLD